MLDEFLAQAGITHSCLSNFMSHGEVIQIASFILVVTWYGRQTNQNIELHVLFSRNDK